MTADKPSGRGRSEGTRRAVAAANLKRRLIRLARELSSLTSDDLEALLQMLKNSENESED